MKTNITLLKFITKFFLSVCITFAISLQGFSQTVIWSEDFSGGIPASWTQSGTCDWEYDFDGTNGAYGATQLASTTAANGFIIFDSDSLDNGGVQNNFGNGPCPAPHTGVLTTDAIDLTGYSGVKLKFQQYFRQFDSETIVSVSNDGVNYTDFVINTAVPQNNATTNPDSVEVDISCIAGNQSAVYLRFTFDGLGDGTSQAYYNWQIDDIELVESSSVYSDIALNAQTNENMAATAPGEYAIMPLKHAMINGLRGHMINNGLTELTNVQLGAEVKNPAGSIVLKDTSSINNLECNADSLVKLNAKSSTSIELGSYTVTFTASMDEDDSISDNNVIMDTVTVSDQIYARDNNTPFGSIGLGDGFSGTIGHIFELQMADSMEAISVYLQNPTVGDTMQGFVYDFNGVPMNKLDSTAIFIVSDTTRQWYTLPLLSGNLALSSDTFFVGIKEYTTAFAGIGWSVGIYTPGVSYGESSALGIPWTPTEDIYNNFNRAFMIRAIMAKPPLTAIDDNAETFIDSSVMIDVQSNDYNPGGGSLTTTIVTDPLNGTAQVMNGDSIEYTPNSGFMGMDSLRYGVCDTGGICDSAWVFINVVEQNFAPTAVDDNATTNKNVSVVVDVQANDSDPDGDPLTTSLVGTPANGSAQVLNGDSVEYTPDSSFVGMDTVNYRVCDGKGLCDDAIVVIEMKDVGINAPVANEVKIHPNPSNGIIKVDIDHITNGNVSVYNIIGELVQIQKINNKSIVFDLSGEPEGIYFIKISSGSDIYTRKVVLTK